MRLHRLCLAALAIAATTVAACNSSSTDDPGATPIEDAGGDSPTDSGVGGESGGDAVTTPPIDSGVGDAPDPDAGPRLDPCRGGVAVPTDQAFVAEGMCARVVAQKQGSIRQLTFAPNGDLYGVTTSGNIRRYRDANGDGQFQSSEIVDWANTGGNGNNCHVDSAGGYLYAGSPGGVKRWKWTPDSASGGAGEDLITDQPTGGHGYHTVHVYDGYLYVHSGSAGNETNDLTPAYDTNRSLLRRFDLSKAPPWKWADGEVVVVGLRNMIAFKKNAAGRMFGVVNGLDNIHYAGADVHNDNPGEQMVLLEKGKQYGYPFCFTAQRVTSGGAVMPAGTQLFNEDFASPHDDAWCASNSSPPATFIQAHSAPMDLAFYDSASSVLPAKWRGGAFIALHGSWDRSPSTGEKVIWMPFDAASGMPPMPTSTASATTFPYQTVFGGGSVAAGPQDGAWSWSAGGVSDTPRPVGVAISPVDGALYISSDSGGTIYRLGIKG